MQQTKPFDELTDDEMIPGRLYNDGKHNIWIVKTTSPSTRKRTLYRESHYPIRITRGQ